MTRRPSVRVDWPLLITDSGTAHVEGEDTRGDRIGFKVICGVQIGDAYHARGGGKVTCQRCLQILARDNE